MRFATTALMALVAVGLPGPAVAQTPVHPVDIEIASLDAAPTAPGQLLVTVGLLFVNDGPAGIYDTDLYIELDGMPAASVPVYVDAAESICDLDPDCNDVCDIQTSGNMNTFVNCRMWDTWGPPLGGCDPYDPYHTCVPVQTCACHAPFTVEVMVSGEGDELIVASVDHGGTMIEADETNNMMILWPTPIPRVAWGTLKARYR